MKRCLLLLSFFASSVLGFGEKSYITLLKDHQKVRKNIYNETIDFFKDVADTELKNGENPFSDGPVSETKNHSKWRRECAELYKKRQLNEKHGIEYKNLCSDVALYIWNKTAQKLVDDSKASENMELKQAFSNSALIPRNQWHLLVIEQPFYKNLLERMIAMDIYSKKS